MKLAQMFSNAYNLDALEASELMKEYEDRVIDGMTGEDGLCFFIIFNDDSSILVSRDGSVHFEDPHQAVNAIILDGIRVYRDVFPGVDKIRCEMIEKMKRAGAKEG